eukprot:CAMPEP_0195521100 /NCGR_PEP_ID=MMETSP0794_2-20130614/17952_1 /TAXON_ID=515487 /ORGANISM="Stephanopyxis turris, Strain CCMP 815" /LENGTH=778 /DNA_ID=CAMNT_0040650573 /DNA_START=46 /DNA_END=2382 /DNA_ORIENTATION=+
MLVEKYISLFMHRLLASEADDHGDTHSDVDAHGADDHADGHSEFGVHITYEDLYASIIFFTAIYVLGVLCSRLLKFPELVGQVFAGIILGPPVLNYVPNAEAFVMLGEIGLILLVLEAGIDVDLTTLHLIGPRGVSIAIIGSILPIGIGIGIGFALGYDTKASIAAGAAFGPTSLGIAMNILRTAKIINTPVGQMIVAAAVIDDMIALVVLSQLSALTGDVTVAGIVIPIISALGFLVIGGVLAITVVPKFLNRFVFDKVSTETKGPLSLAIMIVLLLGLMPATYYAKASFLMGSFIAGLAFCSNHEAHDQFQSQFKRVMQWLLRIFFAASIGFQVPIKEFGNGTVVWQGFVFTLALLGKLAVGFMVPNFTHSRRYTELHLRDVLVVGFSMAAEGEFAFVIAVFSVDSGLISKTLYASIVLAVLLSTVLAPFALRLTINRYNKKTENVIKEAGKLELDRKMKLGDVEEELVEKIKKTTVFLCIQTLSASGWGLLPKMMRSMFDLELEVIDHRSWNPRGVNTTLVNEIYAQDKIQIDAEDAETVLANRIEEVQKAIFSAIGQEDATVKVTRWYPGVVEEIVEETTETETKTTAKAKITVSGIEGSILSEATAALEKNRIKQTSLTTDRPVDDITNAPVPIATTSIRPRPRRTKTRSTPVIGGDMFSSPSSALEPSRGSEQVADVVLNGQTFKVRFNAAAVQRISSPSGGRQEIINDSDIAGPRRRSRQVSYDNMLQGFVRRDETATKAPTEGPMRRLRQLSQGRARQGSGGGFFDPIKE